MLDVPVAPTVHPALGPCCGHLSCDQSYLLAYVQQLQQQRQLLLQQQRQLLLQQLGLPKTDIKP